MKFTTIPDRSADSRRARRLLFAAALGVLAGAFSSMGQTILTIAFEGPPSVPFATGRAESAYSESGMRFGRLGIDDILRVSSGYFADPDNGTTYLVGALGGHSNTVTIGLTAGWTFDLRSVDLAEYLFSTEPTAVRFLGYRHDGSIVTTDLTTDGINDSIGPQADFQTFHFGPEFSGLDRIEIPSHGWSLDNLVVLIPEPSSLVLLAGGECCALAYALRSSRRRR